MRWLQKVRPWLTQTLGDVAGILFVAVVIGGLLVLYLWKPFMGSSLTYLNYRPGWTCTYPTHIEPVCVKDVKRIP